MNIKNSPFVRKLLQDGSWVLLGKISSLFAGFVGVRLITEFVSPEVYGAYSLVLGLALFSIGLLASSLLTGGQRIYADQITPTNKRLARQVILELLRKGQLVIASLFLLGGMIYTLWKPDLGVWIFLIFSSCIIISTERTLDINLLHIARRQKAVAIWQSVELWLRPALIIACVVLWAKRPAAIALGYTLSIALTMWIFHTLPLQLEGVGDPANDSATEATGSLHASPEDTEPPTSQQALTEQIKNSIIAYSLPLIPVSIVGQIHSVGDRYLIGGMLGVKEVGIYVTTYGLLSYGLLTIGSVAAMTLYPNFVNAIRDKNESRRKRLAWMWPCAVFLSSAFVAVVLYVLQDFIYSIALAKQYHDGKELMIWILAGFIFLNVSSTETLQMYAYNKTKNALYNEVICAVTSMAVSIPMIYWKGLKGAAMACAAYYFLYMVIGFFFMKRSERQWRAEQEHPEEQVTPTEPTST